MTRQKLTSHKGVLSNSTLSILPAFNPKNIKTFVTVKVDLKMSDYDN